MDVRYQFVIMIRVIILVLRIALACIYYPGESSLKAVQIMHHHHPVKRRIPLSCLHCIAMVIIMVLTQKAS